MRSEIGEFPVLPAGGEEFGTSPAAFGKPRVGRIAVPVEEYNAAGFIHSFFGTRRGCVRHSLESLAMVVAAYVESVVVSGVFPVCHNVRGTAFAFLTVLVTGKNLAEYPAAGHHGMGL